MAHDTYQSPLASRYASDYMLRLFSDDSRYQTWRRLWAALARVQHELGLPITEAQAAELEAHITDIDYDIAAQREREVRHDVMAHVYAYGKAAPSAAGIIHLGATSCYVTDNADLILYRDGLVYLRRQLLAVLANLAAFAEKYAATPTLGYTHYQPAQPVTVGKRATLWMQDLLADVEELDHVLSTLKFLGCRGTTGTEASFMDLFDGGEAKIDEMNRRLAASFGFKECFPVCGQTYPRKVDSRILSCLSGIAQSAYRMANDIRLLQHDRQLEEPFETEQIGSSAMAYKRNPMRCERICSLGPYLVAGSKNRPMAPRRAGEGGAVGGSPKPPYRAAGGLPVRRRGTAPVPERNGGSARQRGHRGPHPAGVPAVSGHGGPDDGGCKARRRPPAAARDHPAALHGRHGPHEGGPALRSAGPSGGGSCLRPEPRGAGAADGAAALHRTLPPAGAAVSGCLCAAAASGAGRRWRHPRVRPYSF